MNELTIAVIITSIILLILGLIVGGKNRRLSAPDRPPCPYDYGRVQELETNPDGLQASEED